VLTDLEITVTVRFGYTSRNVSVKKHYHNYVSVVTPPTCTEKGYVTHSCRCGADYVDGYTDVIEHQYSDGICTMCKTKQILTFQILDTRSNQMEVFSYEVGMTWKEWLNSEYNVGMGSCSAIWVSVGPDIVGGNPHMDIFVNGDPTDYDDVICREDILTLVRYQ
jgi:hypothetical protein